ncbi:hypothetical protein Tco_1251210, partial [Tanacetum coccineum]
IIGWVVCSDDIMESCDAVMIFVVMASRCASDVISSHCREILDQLDYPADGGDDDDDDDSYDDDEASEEEEEHLALTNSVIAPSVDSVPSSEETELFETNESAATPPSSLAGRTTARISIRP